MRKLTKKSLEELAKVMPIVSNKELCLFVAGTGNAEVEKYTLKEYLALLDANKWTGGYVDGEGYIMGTVVVTPSGNSGSVTGVLDDAYWDRLMYSQYTGNPTGESGYYPGDTNSGGIGGIGGTNNGSNSLKNNFVMTTNQFVGYDPKDPNGCFRRCQDMLGKFNLTASGADKTIAMMSLKENGRAGEVTSSYQTGISYINEQLQLGRPVVVGVDFKDSHPGNADKMTDHFIVIVGMNQTRDSSGNITTTYRFFDPQSQYSSVGASADNILTVTSNGISGAYKTSIGNINNYTITQVRYNNSIVK